MNEIKINEICKHYNSSIDGLSTIEAKKRLEKNGYNIINDDKKINPIKIFLAQLINPLVYVLIVGFILSLILKEYTDAIIIIVVVLINSFLSTFQELKAEKALLYLKNLTPTKCMVKRDGKIIEIDSKELVIGDIEILETGKTICGDLKLIKSNHLMIDESSLTGESIASSKDSEYEIRPNDSIGDQKCNAFMSTMVVKGNGIGIVTSTGMNTQIGKIAKLLKEEKKSITPLQKKLNELSNVLAISTVILCVFIFVIAILQKRDKLEMLITSISLAVAVIPEGLLAVVTIVLSLGVLRLSKVNAIIKKLPSVETLGCVNVVCSDKTGTLTLNKMNLEKIYTNKKIVAKTDVIKSNDLLAIAAINCCDVVSTNNELIGDPMEVAIVNYFNGAKLFPKKDEIPFDSNRKMMSTYNPPYVFSKGSIDSILNICDFILIDNCKFKITQNIKNEILSNHDDLANNGYRVIAVAYKQSSLFTETQLTFLGLLAFVDPLREEVIPSIKVLKEAGIKTVMITGDHKATAVSIAKQLNIVHDNSQVITGKEIDNMDQDVFEENIDKYNVFARVSPENKMQIVKAFKNKGNVVAMTGDGINDAVSLKAADIGISMGISGTDVAKNASDIVLMDDNFTTIEKAVLEGRGIFNNIKKTILFLLSSNIGEVLVMLLCILLKLPIPLIAIHILWVNLLTDSVPSLALGQDKVNKDVMKEKPRNINDSIFKNKGWFIILFYGAVIGLLSFAAYLYVPIDYLLKNNIVLSYNEITYLLKNNTEILLKAQTYAFSTLALSQLFHSIGIKNLNQSIFNKDTLNNKLLIFSVIFGILIQMMVTMLPPFVNIFKTSLLSMKEFLIILLFSIIPLIVHEIGIIFKKVK